MLKRSGETNEQNRHPLAEIYVKLMRDSCLWTDGLDSALRAVIAAVSGALGVRRTGLWSFGSNRQTLTLLLGYDAAYQNFRHGAEVNCALFPAYFQRLDTVLFDAVSDVHSDPRMQEFAAQDMLNADLKAMLSSTVRVVSTSWGILGVSDFVEMRTWSERECWFLAAVADLIAHLITTAEAHRNEGWLRFVADNLPLGALTFDLDMCCDYVNPYWQHLTGVAAEAALGNGWLQSVHPEDRDAMLNKLRMVLVSGERDEAEMRLLVRDKTVWVACSWVSERNVEGMPVAVLGTFADVTHERTLRENEKRYRALFNNSSEGIFLMAGDRTIDCNVRAEEMFGCTHAQIIQEPSARFSPLYQPDGQLSEEKGREKIIAALRGEQQFFQWQHMRYDGTQFAGEVTLTYVTLNDRPHLLTSVRDISRRKAAEDALRQSSERLHRINSIAARLSGLRDIEAVARASVEILSKYGSAPLARFLVFDAETRAANLVAQRDGHGFVESTGQLSHWILETEYADQVHLDTEVDVLTNLDLLPISDAIRAVMQERGTRSIVYIWLRGEVERIGLVILEYREVIELEAAQRDDLVAIGKAISTALSNVLFISRTEHQATHDMLTGLPNRVLLQRELQTLNAQRDPASGLMLLDLDRFKEVNDTLGHHLGDQLLIILARRLADALCDKNALICRLGGDEFAILMRDATPERLQEAAANLLELLRQPLLVGEFMLEIGGSIGIALFPRQSVDGSELLRLADVAMYQAKRSGGGCALYDREFDSYTPERLALMQELRSAIHNKQIVLHYQPKLNLHSDDITGFEALVRWQHPQRGLLPPAAFLPFAEVSDVIHALTVEVLQQALMQQREWLRRGLRYSIAVNLSARNLINEQCFVQLRQMIEEYGSDATLLELEITETALMLDPIGAARQLEELTALGIKFSIDDFGTGYSSLAYLRQLPIHALKIDRTFVKDMVCNEQDAMIVKSTIALAHNLKLDVIAEGVEDEATLAMLRSMSCDHVQGYFICKPQSAAVIDQWLQEAAWPRR